VRNWRRLKRLVPRPAEPSGTRAALAILAVAALSLSACAGRQPEPKSGPAAPQNVLLIVVDSLRADHLGAYGYARPTSPRFDRLAREGALFERAITQGAWTRPSIASLFTSLYAHVHGATRMGTALSDDAITIAEVLRSNGFATMAVQTNPTVTAAQNFTQGFETYVERIGGSAPRVLSRFHEWLDHERPRRFFGYLHFMDVHLPYDAPEPHRHRFVGPYSGVLKADEIHSRSDVLPRLSRLSDEDRRHVAELYDASINYFDEYLGRLTDDLERRALLDETLILIVADHGEELFDHGWFEHGHSVHRELVRVPFLIRHPRLVPRGVRIGQLVRLIDVFPTIVGMLGLDPPADLMGRDLRPAIADPSADWGLPGLTDATLYGPAQIAIERGPYKLMRVAASHSRRDATFMAVMTAGKTLTGEGAVAFYDLASDPDERRSMMEHPQAERWQRLLEDEQRQSGGRTLAAGPEIIDDEQREQLRSLGYLR
jgi:arylsulfatase A-like enzyme